MKINDNAYALFQLSRRSLKIFLKDGMAVLFSMLAPLIILLLYVLFLGDLQVESVTASLPENIAVDPDTISAFVDAWMIAGVMSVACITVSLSANTVMVQDRERGVNRDALASPVSAGTVTLGYFVYNLVVTLFICLVVYAVCLVYMAASGGFLLSVAAIFEVIGVLVLSVLSSTLITVFIAGFFKTNSAFSAFVGIVSAVIGFVIGAYMPVSVFPAAVRNVVCFFPGSYSALLFRNVFMSGALTALSSGMPADFTAALEDAYSMRLDFFGASVDVGAAYIVLAASVVLFLTINLIMARLFPKKY